MIGRTKTWPPVEDGASLVGAPTAELADVSADEMRWVEDPDLQLPMRRRMHCCDMVTAALIPWTTFAFSLSLFVCLYHDHAGIVWTLQIIAMLLAVCSVATGALARDAVVTSLGFLSLASVALGAAVGTWLEAEYLQRFWQLYRSSKYLHIQSDQPQKLPTDVFLRFPESTRLDESRSLGYLTKGNIYCVAPIFVSGQIASEVWYWAVGKNCCERRHSFGCGPQPQQAAVLAETLDNTFLRAVLQASSVYQIKASETPRLVTLVEHPSQLLAELWYESTKVAVLAGLMHLAVCMLTVLTMATATAYGRKLKG
eukprot:CAMPEP_0181408448 /NCGR_PEP_ID=MMETSP1110-20121109/6304_1 /TAXON_ID=174948 /ORGANISM="Symbiodinium sp., Strain CCMP421" /LENGTH=311 /DNA_ID=CAMNT_0023530915 /DNA_START=55 /DNA_END=990 /DNA_ORIENTATION=+